MKKLSQIFMTLLLIIHIVLLFWAIAGLTEWFTSDTPWERLSNPLFSDELLMVHWLSILIASLVFILGFIFKWRFMPAAMIIAYSLMASVCAVETFFFLEHSSRYWDMVIEYVAYLSIILFLYNSESVRQQFKPG